MTPLFASRGADQYLSGFFSLEGADAAGERRNWGNACGPKLVRSGLVPKKPDIFVLRYVRSSELNLRFAENGRVDSCSLAAVFPLPACGGGLGRGPCPGTDSLQEPPPQPSLASGGGRSTAAQVSFPPGLARPAAHETSATLCLCRRYRGRYFVGAIKPAS